MSRKDNKNKTKPAKAEDFENMTDFRQRLVDKGYLNTRTIIKTEKERLRKKAARKSKKKNRK